MEMDVPNSPFMAKRWRSFQRSFLVMKYLK